MITKITIDYDFRLRCAIAAFAYAKEKKPEIPPEILEEFYSMADDFFDKVESFFVEKGVKIADLDEKAQAAFLAKNSNVGFKQKKG